MTVIRNLRIRRRLTLIPLIRLSRPKRAKATAFLPGYPPPHMLGHRLHKCAALRHLQKRHANRGKFTVTLTET